ncbi:MAG: CDP-diacylglycerol--glycerol-3-phosphate 3-phosphatidyltransferase [Oscillospiraceae bacterium]|nr:CDP-diacylglycerol--glycerol-3-phosphate 3-phosphatidyltransferase [Oscillospiraceae bacterium]MBQ2794430.1 CDP-diacylglycerol--glycerol-3-phosphate 3-phosphatidyltransferase [Oscillospiraceae bacterium]MBQ2861669.1 CDP-diacylglycerol--glycerol-3-phosphate 3-phosphatidyltransferase [Oscillospiraceae bacterium]MBQ2998605.1 CDP-diacylglycerol--glycerol-3-phosphate 3-phosphatidyltransferase [Oscillospiraceae bacterium]MBQ3236943.1 CDP-diacylglycerol--glycerol-3-phosphate 3-phosphatidyltransfera
MNLPNLLTLLRVAMIPLFVLAFLSGTNGWIALVIFILAALTDALDGYIARKQNIVTDFGKLMDPLADKLMVMSAFICFTAVGLLHPAVTIIIMSREFLVTGLRSIASSKGRVIAADIWGKLKTIAQDVCIIAVLLWQAISGGTGFFEVLCYACIWIMTILTVFSAVNYCVKNKDLFSAK